MRLALALALAAVASGAAAQAPRYEGAAIPGFALDAAPPDTTERPADPWLGPDKALHAGGSFLMTLAGQYVLTDKGGLSDGQALPVAAGSTLALGLLKEVADSRRARRPHFSWRDLAADAAGVALAAAVVAL